jgi:hypothetical protein
VSVVPSILCSPSCVVERLGTVESFLSCGSINVLKSSVPISINSSCSSLASSSLSSLFVVDEISQMWFSVLDVVKTRLDIVIIRLDISMPYQILTS